MISVWFYDLTSNESVGVKADRAHTAASTYKIPVILYLYHLAATNRVSLDSKVAVWRGDWRDGTGILNGVQEGTQFTLRELARLVLVHSDNTATNVLLRTLGVDPMLQYLHGIGVHYHWDKHQIAPKDLGLAFLHLWRQAEESPQLWGEPLAYLKQTIYKDWLPQGLPKGVETANKMGALNASFHDAGIVYHRRRPYVLVVMTEGMDENTAGYYITQVSREVWGWHDGRTESAPGGAGLAPASAPENRAEDLLPRLQQIFQLRAQWLLTGATPPPIDSEYLPGSKTGQWALLHEQGKIRYVRQWAENRGVRIVEAQPAIRAKRVSGNADRARFYVEQSLALGYVYPGESTVNRFGVGTRHIIELRRQGLNWLIHLEWYTDPLGDDTEVPDVTPAFAARQTARGGYDRDGAIAYADTYCGTAWGCGNNNRYNPRYSDYNGVGGDCTNFIAQALRDGGKLNLPLYTRVESLAGHLQWSGLATVTLKQTFRELWKQAAQHPGGFSDLLKKGDLIAYQEKGKLEHFGIVTGFDSHQYPLVNTHTADRYRVPFDLGWDRKTIYWFFRMHG